LAHLVVWKPMSILELDGARRPISSLDALSRCRGFSWVRICPNASASALGLVFGNPDRTRANSNRESADVT